MREKQNVVNVHSNNLSWTVYTRDTAVRQADVLPETRVPKQTTKEEKERENRQKRWQEDVRKHAIDREMKHCYERSNGMHRAELLIIIGLLSLFLVSCVFMLYEQSMATAAIRSSNAKKQQYQTLIQSNNILESKIELSIDPKLIKEKAILELNMGYPSKSQVIYYQNSDLGYVSQLEDIPEE